MKTFLAAAALLAANSFAADARTADLIRNLSAQRFQMCQGPCGRTGTAPSCCRCWGGVWIGGVKGGHCT